MIFYFTALTRHGSLLAKEETVVYVYHVSLSQPEVETLEQMYRFAPKRRLRQRAHMILLSNQRYCQKEVANIVGTSYPTARRVIHAYSVYGLAALYDRDIPGCPAQLSLAQLKQIDIWLSESPRAVGYNQSNWTARLMRYHIKKTWGIELSEESIRRWIHRLGYTLVRPRYNNQRVDEAEKKRPLMTWRIINNAQKREKFVSFSSTKSN